MSDKVLLIQEEPRGPSELVEIPVTQDGQYRIVIPDNQQLRSLANQTIIIQGIRLIPAAALTNGPITGYATAPDTEVVKCVLVLYSQGWEKGHYIPLAVLNDLSISASGLAHRYAATKFQNWRNVDWSKSYILYSGGTGGSNTGGTPYAFLLDVTYIKLDADGNPILGPS